MQDTHDRTSGPLGTPSETDTAPVPVAGDPLSDVLRSVRLRGALFFLVESTCPWCIDIPRAADFAGIILPGAGQVVSYHVVVEGGGIAVVPGAEPVEFTAGDIIVLPHGDPYLMQNAPGVPPELDPAGTLRFFRDIAAGRLPPVVREGGGGPPPARFVCGFLGCDIAPFNPLMASLPPLLHVRRPAGGADLLDRLVDLAMAEIRAQRPGGESIRLGLCELMFIEVLRRQLAAQAADAPGWLAGLRDPAVGRALALLHAEPARGWTLDALAQAAGVSRSVLAERFAARLGQPPMRYLTLWRMQIAARLLADRTDKVAAIADRVGFGSEAAFSRGFKRETGMSPAEWRRRQTAGTSAGQRLSITSAG